MSKQMTVKVTLEEGSFWAEVEEFPGLFATGDTLAELTESLREGLELYLSESGGPQAKVKITDIQQVEKVAMSTATSVEYAYA